MKSKSQIYMGRKNCAVISGKHFEHPNVSDILSAQIRRQTQKLMRKNARKNN